MNKYGFTVKVRLMVMSEFTCHGDVLQRLSSKLRSLSAPILVRLLIRKQKFHAKYAPIFIYLNTQSSNLNKAMLRRTYRALINQANQEHEQAIHVVLAQQH